MPTHYETLGVASNASSEEIKRAYRKLASQHHPDKGGDTAKFQSIQTAYDAIGDEQKRRQYDHARHNPGSFNFTVNGQDMSGMGGPFDFNSIFNMFGTKFSHPGQQRPQHARMELWITLMDIAQGGRRTVTVGTHQGTMAVEIEIPAGIDDGNTVQYNGIGPGGMDLIITFRIHAHPRWQRNGLNLTCEHVVNIWDLILGSEIKFTDIYNNELMLTVPEKTQPGTQLRLKGRGLKSRTGQSGDTLVRLQAQIPNDMPQELIDMIKSIRQE